MVWGKCRGVAQYTTNNVVTYTQDPDVAVRTLCLLPGDLCKDLYVQFEGSDPGKIAFEKPLMVDLAHLREGMWFFVSNCWPWMEATKMHGPLSMSHLGAHLETLGHNSFDTSCNHLLHAGRCRPRARKC